MGRISELEMAISDLHSAAATINDVANTLAELFGGTGGPAKEVPAPEKPKLTLESVRAVLADLSRAGHTAQIRELLQKHGAAKLSGIDPANYQALLDDAEGLRDAP